MILFTIMAAMAFNSTSCFIEDSIFVRTKVIKYYQETTSQHPSSLIEYKLVNNTSDALYTWIEYDLQSSKRDASEAFALYIGRALSTSPGEEQHTTVVGKTFLKRIEANNVFRYMFLNDKGHTIRNIFYLLESEMNEECQQWVESNNSFFFMYDYIVIP